MPKQVKHRRGTTAQHASFTGALAELTVDTTKKTVVVHDGATPGGFPLASEASQLVRTGNLVWVDDDLQDKLKNKAGARKLKILRQHGGIWIDGVLRGARSWSGNEIKARAKHLASVAYTRVWHL